MKHICNARILGMGAQDYPDGADMLIDDAGKIIAIDTQLTSPGATVIDAGGCYMLPGIIDAHCHVGMWEDSLNFEGDDGNEVSDPVTAEMRALDGINPEDRAFVEAMQAGVTLLSTGPGSANPIGGQFLAMRTAGRTMEEMLVKEPLALKIAFGENPKTVYHHKDRAPHTRMATAAIIRQAFIDAQEYQRKLALGEKDPDKIPERSLQNEIMVRALNREILVKAHAHRADDILTALRIADEFGLDMTLEHCTEGYRIADILKAKQARPIIGPLFSDRSKPELRNMTFKAPAIMHQAGLEFAMMTDHPVIPIQYLIVCAGIAVREGLPQREALKSITINAARAIGLARDHGSLEVGKRADLALYDAHPLDVRAHVKMVMIGGEIRHEA